MKLKRKTLMLLITIVLSFTFTACSEQRVEEVKESAQVEKTELQMEGKRTREDIYTDNEMNHYNINIRFNPQRKILTGQEKINYINEENIALKEIYFHLYPNAFQKKETAPFLFDSFDQAFPKGFSPGHIKVSNIKVNQKEVEYKLEGEAQTLLKILLPEALKSGESVEVTMDFEVQLPPARDRFGYGEDTYNLGNWYPIVAVYDESGWNLDPYYSIGDPFYSDIADYHVTISAPEEQVIAPTGRIIDIEKKEKESRWIIEAKAVRDFAWVASKHFDIKEKKIGNTLVKSYYLNNKNHGDAGEEALEIAVNSIKIFNERFGEYPYEQYRVIETSFPSGMEYPQVVFIGDNYYEEGNSPGLHLVIAHETAHQWWYGLVGNDEIDEAWLDEGITEYSTLLYYEEQFGKSAAESYKESIENRVSYLKELPRKNRIVVKPLGKFESWSDYGDLVYQQGAYTIYSLREEVGDETFFKIMQTYFEEYKFRNATTENFKEVVEEITGKQWDGFFNKHLLGKKVS